MTRVIYPVFHMFTPMLFADDYDKLKKVMNELNKRLPKSDSFEPSRGRKAKLKCYSTFQTVFKPKNTRGSKSSNESEHEPQINTKSKKVILFIK